MSSARVALQERGGSLGTPALQLLSELQSAHTQLLASIAVMEDVTALPKADLVQLTRARLKISQASLARRFIWRRIQEHLLCRVRLADCARLRDLTHLDLKQFQRSSAHVSRWTGEAAVADWPGYQAASKAIREHMLAGIKSERTLLYPMLYRYR